MNYRFRKKPVVVEAFQMTLERRLNKEDWPKWLDAALNNAYLRLLPRISDGIAVIDTPEGPMYIGVDDYIIRGVKGELYPCKPDIFKATYESVDDPEVPL